MSSGHRVLDPVGELDRIIFDPGAFTLATGEEEVIRTRLVADAVRHHLEHCPPYASFAERRGFHPDAITDYRSLDAVPQFPSSVFKRTTVISGPADDMAKRCVSSGTLGRESVVWRDRITLERLLGSLRSAIDEFVLRSYEDEIVVLNLGPDEREAGDLWFAYLMSLVELSYPTVHLVRGGELAADEAIAEIRRAVTRGGITVLTAPPALVLDVAEAAEREPKLPDNDSLYVVTGGGWKRATGVKLDQQTFTRRIQQALRIRDTTRIRDAFNQVELNTVLMECEAKRKHVPPWVHVVIRDPASLAPLPAPEVGLLSYLDASAHSYPCFIIADDYGFQSAGSCGCGRPGRTVEFVRRVERAQEWGCALKMDRAYGKPTPA